MGRIEYRNHDRFLLSVDCIIFGFDGKGMKALIVKRALEPETGKWSLSGGFVKKEESVDQAAERILVTLTGLEKIYMEQLHCFGDISRDPGGRVVSIAYYALIKIDASNEQLLDTHNAQWVDLHHLPPLIFDHNQMVKMAKERLQQKVANHPIGFELLPHKFTLQQLLGLYEAIYETNFDKRNFTRKILALGILQRLNEKERESSKKGAFYYVFDKKKYKQLEHEGIKLI
ncbi:NUDIX hydrolase [Flavihumibacter profundi]|uniref:NUDIX hydrolase n=1 Tax=Flavihumibacter profundi TaxID=2716883 RepID=UPI001CC73BAC|nr:NUDIX domain-containing protein [Flavihumibacter profundi]MBZ5857522.1 NUDIX domain-containing protein [Flavihumibacter profundi]